MGYCSHRHYTVRAASDLREADHSSSSTESDISFSSVCAAAAEGGWGGFPPTGVHEIDLTAHTPFACGVVGTPDRLRHPPTLPTLQTPRHYRVFDQGGFCSNPPYPPSTEPEVRHDG